MKTPYEIASGPLQGDRVHVYYLGWHVSTHDTRAQADAWVLEKQAEELEHAPRWGRVQCHATEGTERCQGVSCLEEDYCVLHLKEIRQERMRERGSSDETR